MSTPQVAFTIVLFMNRAREVMGKLFPVESWHAAPETLSKMQLATVTFTTRFVPGAGPAV